MSTYVHYFCVYLYEFFLRLVVFKRLGLFGLYVRIYLPFACVRVLSFLVYEHVPLSSPLCVCRVLCILQYLSSLATSGPRGSVDDLCLICQDPKSLEPELSLLPCGHSFCVDCAGLLYQQHKAAKTAKCPLCRKPFQPSAVAVVVVPPAASSSSSSSSAGPALSAPLIQGPPDAATASVPGMLGHVVKGASSLKVKGSHSSKIAALLSCVLELRRTEPSAKSIVFSQWEAVLDIVETALSQNRVPSLRPGSTKTPTKLTKLQDVVHLFCGEDSPAAVLLLPLAKAGKGINITAANHVFLIDATLTPDLDAQGIARVDRLGQTKPTFVHRFIASNTIEDTIFRLNRQYRTAHRGGVWVGRTPTGGEDVVCREDITLLLRTAQAALKKPTPEAASAPVVVE